MPLTLEMPATDVADEFALPATDNHAAAEAEQLLDQAGGDEAGDGSGGEPVAAEPQPVADDHPKQEKKKRGRKKKQEQAEATPAGPVDAPDIESTDAPPAVDESPADLPADSSPATPPQGNDLLDEIAAAEIACDDAERIVLSLKEELKAAKKEYDGAVHKLRKLCRAVRNDSTRPLIKSPAKPAGAASETADGRAATAPADTDGGAAPADWRTVSIDALNLSPKLADKLREANADTIGRLEDLRAEISQGRAKWPKGIGSAKITDIENAVIGWLSKHRDAEALAASKSGGDDAAGKAGDSQPPGPVKPDLPATAATPAPTIDASTVPDFDTWDAMPDDQQRDYVCARAVILDDGRENSLSNRIPDSKCWDSGYEAYGRDLKVSECPYIPGENMDDWLRGWLARGKVDNYEPPAPGEVVVEKEWPTAPVLADIDDL